MLRVERTAAARTQAKIIPFQARKAPGREVDTRTIDVVECGSGWYHEAAVKEDEKTRPRH